MKEKTYHQLLVALFVLFLGGMLAVNIFTQDQEFSPTENRYLKQFPELSKESVTSGVFMEEFETYVTDQFAGRDHWVSLKANMERMLGKQENNSVFFGENDTLINRLPTPDPETMRNSAGYVNKLAANLESQGVPLYVGLIPSAATVWSHLLPQGADTADETQVIQEFYGNLADNITTIPLVETLSQQKEQDLYYRTDHHWTSYGAYYGYFALMNAMGHTPASPENYQPVLASDQFYGTIFSGSGVRWVPPDSIVTFVPEDGNTVTSFFQGQPEEGALYVPEYLDKKDKYSYFLGGIQPLCIIETQNTQAPSVLVLRDSYSDCLAPFLTENFSQIHLLDLRFYNASVAGYVQANQLDQVVVLYSLTNFANDNHLFKLGM